MTIEKWSGTQLDLSQTAFRDILAELKCDPHQEETILYCGDDLSDVAYEIENEFGALAFIVPPQILRSAGVWAVEAKGRTIWLEPPAS